MDGARIELELELLKGKKIKTKKNNKVAILRTWASHKCEGAGCTGKNRDLVEKFMGGEEEEEERVKTKP